jgi:hypothetical protein
MYCIERKREREKKRACNINQFIIVLFISVVVVVADPVLVSLDKSTIGLTKVFTVSTS